MAAVAESLGGTSPGRSFPLGASFVPGGVNFSVFSRSASAVDLLLFDRADDNRPARVIPIDPSTNRSYHYWHVLVPGVETGQLYGYRVHGPSDPANGLRFDSGKVLLDPYSRGVVVPATYSRDAARLAGDRPLRHPSARTIVYEMQVRGFTQHPSAGLSEETHINLAITFKPSFAGAKTIYGSAQDRSGATNGLRSIGTYTVQ